MLVFRVFLNERSGTAGGKAAEIAEMFRGMGAGCEVTALGPGMDLGKLAGEALRRGEVLVAAGGDGTVNAIAAAVAGTDGAMGVIPVGTLNHFAKDAGVPLEVEAAVRAIVAGRTRRVDVGEVNEKVFVNNSSLGFYPAMVSERERLKKVGLNKWISLTVASLRSLVRFRRIAVTVEVKGEKQTMLTPFVFVGNNEYKTAAGGAGIGTRERMDKGELFLSVGPGMTRWGLVRLSMAALRGRVKEESCYEEYCVPEFTVDVRRRDCRVSLDGEVQRMSGPLGYKVRAGALGVFVPAAESESAR